MRTAASLFQELCYNNKDNLMAGIIVAGWDKYKGGSVYNIPLGGSLHKQPFAIGGKAVIPAHALITFSLKGSGSTYIYGYCDSAFKEQMTRDECVTFVQNCEYFNMHTYTDQLFSLLKRFRWQCHEMVLPEA